MEMRIDRRNDDSEPTIYVVSDLHLAPIAPEDGIWLRYLTRPFIPDERVVAFFEEIAAAPAAELVLAGDVFDFDLVPSRLAEPEAGFASRWSGGDRSEEAALVRLGAILRDHPRFVEALARLLAAGVPVTILPGNHDTEIAWPAVREALLARLDDEAGRPVRERVSFAPFVYREGLCFIEHGHWHDPFNRPVDVRSGLTADGTRSRLPYGAICQRSLTNHLPAFNSTTEQSYILGVWDYTAHWLRYYAFSRKLLFGSWALGAWLALWNIVRQEVPEAGEPGPEEIDAFGVQHGLPRGAGAALQTIWPAPAIRSPGAVLRVLWLDRFLAASAACIGALVAGLLAGSAVTGALAGVLVLVLAVAALRGLYGTEVVAAYEEKLPDIARREASALDVPFLVLGHVHTAGSHPFGAGQPGGYLNAGAWCAGYLDPECTRPAYPRFTYVTVDPKERTAKLCQQTDAGASPLAPPLHARPRPVPTERLAPAAHDPHRPAPAPAREEAA